MTPDIHALRLRALAVPGVARLADHHGSSSGPRTSRAALRVFDAHVEIDLVVVAGSSVTTTTAALRRALADEVGDRELHLTVVDVDPGC
ncbi:hypothetical protein [Actinomycetospora soli]|uniref:hypothetical protein n=1 Tax=Actinomycetospora soli TaxID=2893887 RepID=UPI001E5E2142|nr:hypothetical protein [Actinomycetospora soli]MCD2186895.1 hypothetical protein [Actinomycetospora soli]